MRTAASIGFTSAGNWERPFPGAKRSPPVRLDAASDRLDVVAEDKPQNDSRQCRPPQRRCPYKKNARAAPGRPHGAKDGDVAPVPTSIISVEVMLKAATRTIRARIRNIRCSTRMALKKEALRLANPLVFVRRPFPRWSSQRRERGPGCRPRPRCWYRGSGRLEINLGRCHGHVDETEHFVHADPKIATTRCAHAGNGAEGGDIDIGEIKVTTSPTPARIFREPRPLHDGVVVAKPARSPATMLSETIFFSTKSFDHTLHRPLREARRLIITCPSTMGTTAATPSTPRIFSATLSKSPMVRP